MLGQSSAVDQLVKFTDQLKVLAAEVAELRRLRAVPQSLGGATAATTNASGDVVVSHGLGTTPTAVTVTPRSTSATPRIQAKTATTFTVRFLDSSFVAMPSTSVAFDWIAHR